MSYGVFRPTPWPAQRVPSAYPAAPTHVTLDLAGSSTPGATITTRVVVVGLLAGASTPTGAVQRAVAHEGLTGESAPTGATDPIWVQVADDATGTAAPSGALGPFTVTTGAAGTLTPVGATPARSVTLGPPLSGAATPDSTVVPVRIVVRGGDGATTPTGLLARDPIKPLAGSTAPGATLPARTVVRATLGGGVTPSGTASPLRAPALGTRVSPPLGIPDGPIAASLIVWTATPEGGQVIVETSVDGGATWQVATSGSAIRRLAQGDTRTARTVLTRTTLVRAAPDAPSPRLHRLEVEVAVDSSREELCPIGVFTLNEVDVADTAHGLVIEMAGADLSRRVSRNRWDDTYVIEAGTNYATAIQDLISNRMPDAQFNFTATVRPTPRLFFGEQSSNDPWQDAQDMATSIGCELFFDARGVCTLRPEPDPDVDASVWEFTDRARPTIIDLHRRVTDENTYNKVIATGEGTSNEVPVRGEAIDSDPSSPTYYLGPYGTVTDRFTSPMITTQEQAQDAAEARLLRVKGATEAVELEVVPMPALEPGDVVTVTRGRSKVEGRFLLDQIKIPLGPEESMRAVGRRQRI